MPEFALSIKQPWATLLAHGLKTIEVRRWPTARRGRVLIHAARVPDARPQAWSHVPPHLREAAQVGGGVIGAAELTACVLYRNAEHFRDDCPSHLNDPDWFEADPLYGFTFANATPLNFHAYPGWFRFFRVSLPVAEPGT